MEKVVMLKREAWQLKKKHKNFTSEEIERIVSEDEAGKSTPLGSACAAIQIR